MEPTDIYTFGQYLRSIAVDSIHETMHFRKRIKIRFGEDFAGDVYDFIIECIPVAIIQQDKQKFKVLYQYNNDYDLTVVFGIKKGNPLKLSLITCYKVESKRRLREDEQNQGQ